VGDIAALLSGALKTVAVRPRACNRERDAIDSPLVAAVGLSEEFARELNGFVQQTMLVDPDDKRRQHLRAYFETATGP
jgi:hypothetical protein